MEDPCKNCHDRQWYARRLDIHFWGEDCPYVCEEYERYKEEKEIDKQKVGEANEHKKEKRFIRSVSIMRYA